MAIDRLGLGDGRGSCYLKWCLTVYHQRLCGVMKITWALETDKFGFKFSLGHLLAMWCWTSQLVYLNLSFVISDKETILLTSGGLLWRLRGHVCKAHRAVPGRQEALNVIHYECSPFLISWSIWLDFFPPWSSPGSPSCEHSQYSIKGTRIVSDSETSLLTVLFQIKVEIIKTLGLKSKWLLRIQAQGQISPLCLECIRCNSVWALVKDDKEGSQHFIRECLQAYPCSSSPCSSQDVFPGFLSLLLPKLF